MAIGPGMIAGTAAGLAGGIGSYFANQSAAERQRAIQDTELGQILAIQIPDPEQQKIVLQRFIQTGQLSPQLEQAVSQSPSLMNQIKVDQGNVGAQQRALSSLEQIGNEGGMRLQDKAALQEAQLSSASKERGSREAIMDNMGRRGMGGSGFALQAQLQAQQGAADRNSQAGLNVAAQAQDRALKSIEGAGNLAGQYRSQDFNEQAQRAQAQDAINRFNAQNLQGVQHSNVGLQNQAQQQNLTEQQRIADQNAKLGNYEQEHNKGLYQQQFNNQMTRQGAANGVYNQQGQNELQQGKNLGNLFSNIGGSGQAAGTASDTNDFWDNYFKKQKSGGGGMPNEVA